MATLTLKNVPDDVYAALKAAAERDRRSMNQEAIACLERSLGVTARGRSDPAEVIEGLRRFRATLPEAARQVTAEQIDQFKREGRP